MRDDQGNKMHLVALWAVARGETPEDSIKQMLRDMGSDNFEGFVEVRNGGPRAEPIYEAELSKLKKSEMN
jgi:hypothetical protein